MTNDAKKCMICGSMFSRIDFPRCFDRMITCGSAECEGKRRKQRWKKLHPKYSKKKKK